MALPWALCICYSRACVRRCTWPCLCVPGFESREQEPGCQTPRLCIQTSVTQPGSENVQLSISSRSLCCGKTWWFVTYHFHALLEPGFVFQVMVFLYLVSCCGSARRQSVPSLSLCQAHSSNYTTGSNLWLSHERYWDMSSDWMWVIYSRAVFCLGLTLPSAAQVAVGCLCHWGRPAESGTTCCSQDCCPHVLFCKVPFQTVGPQHVLGHGLIPPDTQDLALLLFPHHEVRVGPFLQPVEVPLSWQHTQSGSINAPPAFIGVWVFYL